MEDMEGGPVDDPFEIIVLLKREKNAVATEQVKVTSSNCDLRIDSARDDEALASGKYTRALIAIRILEFCESSDTINSRAKGDFITEIEEWRPGKNDTSFAIIEYVIEERRGVELLHVVRLPICNCTWRHALPTVSRHRDGRGVHNHRITDRIWSSPTPRYVNR
jgi:hypothetical protein